MFGKPKWILIRDRYDDEVRLIPKNYVRHYIRKKGQPVQDGDIHGDWEVIAQGDFSAMWNTSKLIGEPKEIATRHYTIVGSRRVSIEKHQIYQSIP